MSKDYVLEIGNSALNDLKELPINEFKQVVVKLLILQTNPQPKDSRRLKGYPDGYQVDQGDYQVLYTVKRDTIRVYRIKQ